MLLGGTKLPEQLPIGAAIQIPRCDLHLRRWVEWHGFVELSGDIQTVRMERCYPSGYFAGEKPDRLSLLLNRRVTKMADIQVTCINKQPRDNPHEGISTWAIPPRTGGGHGSKSLIRSIVERTPSSRLPAASEQTSRSSMDQMDNM
jgi:hypothetical protein